MIYSHKPQRSGKSIQANTNNPPQDPPPPNILTEIPIKDTIDTIPVDTIPVSLDLQIPDIPIEDTTPPVPEICIESPIPEKKISKPQITTIPKPTPKITPKVTQPKVSYFRGFIIKILRIFGRK